jgi:Fur family ferric uptake transcriptional regulator
MPVARTTNGDELRERLASAGVKPTRQRMLVLNELAREHDDATAQALHQRLVASGESVGLATIYRALGAFAEAGVVDELPHSSSETCYRLCSEGHHHHLVCSRCHRVVELGGCRLDPWIERVARAADFVPTGHRLEVTGVCADCRP